LRPQRRCLHLAPDPALDPAPNAVANRATDRASNPAPNGAASCAPVSGALAWQGARCCD
jgi:hypothetical protein